MRKQWRLPFEIPSHVLNVQILEVLEASEVIFGQVRDRLKFSTSHIDIQVDNLKKMVLMANSMLCSESVLLAGASGPSTPVYKCPKSCLQQDLTCRLWPLESGRQLLVRPRNEGFGQGLD